jgi:hypothetical protein
MQSLEVTQLLGSGLRGEGVLKDTTDIHNQTIIVIIIITTTTIQLSYDEIIIVSIT